MVFICFKIVLLGMTLSQVSSSDPQKIKATEGYHILDCDLDCALPPLPLNGHYLVIGLDLSSTPGHLVREETIIQYICDPGFEPFIKSTGICRKGKWETEFTNCQKTENCMLPDYPSNGNFTLHGHCETYGPGTVVPNWTLLQFSCNASFDLIGQRASLCRNGDWLPSLPHCKKNRKCSVPHSTNSTSYTVLIPGDSIIPGARVEEYTALRVICRPEYFLVGHPVTVCIDGEWLNGVAGCVVNNTCILPKYPKNGRYHVVGGSVVPTPGTEVQESTVLSFSCDIPYQLVGSSVTHCQKKNWSHSSPHCQYVSEDCSSIEHRTTGVYLLQPAEMSTSFQAHCDMDLDGGNWTVFQYRFDGSVDFYRNYQNYTDGFGSPQGEHWLGLERMHQITKKGTHELYVELEAHNGSKAYARYSYFKIASSSTGYQIIISGYSGTAEDGMTKGWNVNGMKFSTYDRDQGRGSINCAVQRKGAWWYDACASSNLNGPYHKAAVESVESMFWYYWFNKEVALKTSRMMIRRKYRNEDK